MCFSFPAFALFDDVWSGIIDQQSTVMGTISMDSAGDRVDYEPNLPDGGYADKQNKPRFKSFNLALDWAPSEKWHLRGTLGEQYFVSKRDKIELRSFTVSGDYRFSKPIAGGSLLYSFGVGQNFASSIEKNSYTRYGDYLLKSVKIGSPRDIQVQNTLSLQFQPKANFNWGVFTGIGYTETKLQSVSGQTQSKDGCNYRFNVEAGEGVVEQLGVCGQVIAFSQEYPNYESVEQYLGFNPDKDLTYKALYGQLGINASWNLNRWRPMVGYYYQQIDRRAFDDRTTEAGQPALTQNHTLAGKLRYQWTDVVGVSLTAEYNKYQMLNYLPVLYTGVTTNMFEGSALFFRLSLDLSLF